MTVEESRLDEPEQRVLEELLRGLNDGPVPGVDAADGDEAALSRQLVETFGLLAYENEPQEPPEAVKNKLMNEIAGRRSDSVPVHAGEESSGQARRLGWALPVAATLAVALLGISGWQWLRLDRQSQTIETLAQQLSSKNVELVGVTDEFQLQLERMQSQLALVTSKGVEVCELKPQAAEAAATGARGALFVAADHQHWYLRIDDLEPCPQGRTYQLWFVLADGSAVDGGILDVRKGVELEVSSDTMPEGTTAVHVTLEPAGGSTEPSGPTVLYGDESMRIL